MGPYRRGVRACRRLPDGTAIYVVGGRDPSVRLDLFLKERIPKLSRARIQDAIGGRVEVAGRASLKPATLLRPGDTVIVRPVPPPNEEEPDVGVPVLYRDRDLVVIDKPAGLLAHPSAHVRKGSVTHILNLEMAGPVHLVHRLDRETSGVMVIARSSAVARALSAQLARESDGVEKVYLAAVVGEVGPTQGAIDLPIGKAIRSAVYVKRGVNAQGRPSRTEFTLLARGAGFSLVRIRTFTGRRHQIRVHMAALGHPVVGDKLYGPAESHYLRFIKQGCFDETMRRELLTERQMLHAWRLRFHHPRRGGPIDVSAPLPGDMLAFLRGCGLGEAAEKLNEGDRAVRHRARAGGGLCRSGADPGHRPATRPGAPAVAQAAGDPEA